MGVRRGIAAGVGVVLLLAVAALLVLSLVHAARWRLAADERPYAERALRAGAEEFRETPERYRRLVTPEVVRGRDRVCVTLASRFEDGGGTYQTCYHARTGAVISARAVGASFGTPSLYDRAMGFLLSS